ncbi:hypothetical protein [Bernardetia sp.]|uniref:hypothetical protein n=1 Tax=Bernardetia sp. TaxID=1937974 RepID=UPI0025C38178|nr:hypothetical protein [Bernardetia sp.]
MKICIYLFLMVLLFTNCHSKSPTTLKSSEIEQKEERIKVLSKQVKIYSEILDAEYSLFNVNGFESSFSFGVGASSWHYKIAIEVEKKDVDKWLKGMYEAENPNAKDSVWINDMLSNLDSARKQKWERIIKTSTPKRFTMSATNGRSKVAIIYFDEGIIFQRIIQD